MKWFKHFSNAHTDGAVEALTNEFGVEGYGLYFYAIELIAGRLDSDNVSFELEQDAKMLAKRLDMDTRRVEEIMKFCVTHGLFECNDGKISCPKIAKFIESRNTRNPEILKLIAKMSPIVADKRRIVADCRHQIRLDEIRLDEKRTEEKRKNKKDTGHQVAEFVRLKTKDYWKLRSDFGKKKVRTFITVLDNYKGSSGKKYADDYRAIRNWVVSRVLDDESKGKVSVPERKKTEKELLAELTGRKK